MKFKYFFYLKHLILYLKHISLIKINIENKIKNIKINIYKINVLKSRYENENSSNLYCSSNKNSLLIIFNIIKNNDIIKRTFIFLEKYIKNIKIIKNRLKTIII